VRYLVDTNVISEVRKGSRCNAGVTAWWKRVDDAEIYLSALVIGEIRKGIEMIRPSDPTRASALDRWLTGLMAEYADRIVDVDRHVTDEWGRLSAIRNVATVDGLLAATAKVHRMTLVTRNETDVAGLGAQILDPFARRR
jgi:predicted nucleic acid-binding protein